MSKTTSLTQTRVTLKATSGQSKPAMQISKMIK